MLFSMVVCSFKYRYIIWLIARATWKALHSQRVQLSKTENLYSNDGTAVLDWVSKRAQLVGKMVLSIRLTLVNHEHVLAHLNRIEQLMHFAGTAFLKDAVTGSMCYREVACGNIHPQTGRCQTDSTSGLGGEN